MPHFLLGSRRRNGQIGRTNSLQVWVLPFWPLKTHFSVYSLLVRVLSNFPHSRFGLFLGAEASNGLEIGILPLFATQRLIAQIWRPWPCYLVFRARDLKEFFIRSHLVTVLVTLSTYLLIKSLDLFDFFADFVAFEGWLNGHRGISFCRSG